MKRNHRDRSPWPGIFISALALVALAACSSETSTQAPEEQKPAAAAQNAKGPGINLNAVVARLQKPPDSFHYSLKKQGNPDYIDDEADVTPQTLDGTFTSNASNVNKPPITGKVHAVSSNQDDWQFAVGSLGGIMGLAGEGGLIDESAVVEGTEQVNGYDTTKYSVDTTRLDASQTSILLGAGSFIKGTAWVTSDGCPVKMTLDEEFHHQDGSATKVHYDEAIIKK
jgi:hypothetical protein